MANEKEENFIIKYKKELLIGFIAVLMLIFIVQNSDEIEFQMLFIRLKISLIFLITLFFGLGMLTVWIRYYFITKEKNKKIKELEEKLNPKPAAKVETLVPPPPPAV